MIDLLIVAAFFLMVLSPCVIAVFSSGDSELDEPEEAPGFFPSRR
jgi:hypothetical protein